MFLYLLSKIRGSKEKLVWMDRLGGELGWLEWQRVDSAGEM
jgi:hypothetical protein